MKKTLLLKTLLLLCAIIVGSTSVKADSVTFLAGTDTSTDSSLEKDGITISVTSGTLSRTDNYRIYSGYTMTISSKVGTITNIAFTFSGSYTGGLETSYSPNATTWTSAATSGGQARITKIVVTYTPTVSYTITAESNNTDYGTVSLSGSVITGSPKAGYRYADPAYTVSPANSATVAQEGNEFTVTPSANTTVTINFEAIPTYTVTLGDDNTALTEEIGGAGVTLPARSALNGYSFVGWSETDIAKRTTQVPTTIPAGNYKPAANITLYPVYSKTEGGGNVTHETASVTISDYATANGWENGTQYTSITMDENVSVVGPDNGNNSKFYNTSTPHNWRFYATNDGYFTVSTTKGELTSVTVTYSGNKLTYNDENITSGTAVAVSGTSASFYVSGSSNNSQVSAISVNYDVTDAGTTYYSSNPGQPVATNVVITDPGTLAKDATGTFAYTKDSEEANTKAWTSSDDNVITITDAATGAYQAKGRGTADVTLTLTPTDGDTYESVSVKRTISVTEPVTITASNMGITYSEEDTYAIYAEKSEGYTGVLTYESGNTAIAKVDEEGNITPVAVGITTITISAPGDLENLYTANSKVINVSVYDITGKKDAPTGFELEDLDFKLYIPSTWTRTTTRDDNFQAWTDNTDNDYISANAFVSSTDRRAGTYDYITDEYDLTGYESAELEISHACRYFGTISDGMKLFAKVGDEEQELTINTYPGNSNIGTYVTNKTDLASLLNKKFRIIFRYISDGTSTNTGRWDIASFKITAQKGTISYTIPASGWGTLCCEYPLDFTGNTEVTAYRVADADAIDKDAAKITVTKVEGAVKGGVGLLIKGSAGAHEIAFATTTTETEPANLLVGVLSPTYLESTDGDYTNLGLKDGAFHPYSEPGAIAAGKAYLQIPTAQMPTAPGAKLYIVFDDETTGISTLDNFTISPFDNNAPMYNLAGQRVNKSYKGVVIVNGKKMLNK